MTVSRGYSCIVLLTGLPGAVASLLMSALLSTVLTGLQTLQTRFLSASQDAPIKDAKQTGVILCGQPEMGEAVKKLVISQGVDEDSILTNF